MEKIRKHFYFSGRVQGVGFRYRSYYIAQSMGLTGWVKNLWDDRVEMEVQGTREDPGDGRAPFSAEFCGDRGY